MVTTSIRNTAHFQSRIAAAVEALYVSEQRLRAAGADAIRRTVWSLDRADFRELAGQARVWARVLAETTTAPPSLPRRVFRAIDDHANTNTEHTPHIEASILAVR